MRSTRQEGSGIDAMHLMPESTPRVRHFVKEVADILVHDGDLVGLISNDFGSTRRPPASD